MSRPLESATPADSEPQGTVCTNCGAEGAIRFCPECGQRQGAMVVSMGALVREIIEDQFSLDATLPRTLRALFLKPGLLTAEYVAGRGRRYIPPFRLFLMASFTFFLALAVATWVGRANRRVAPAAPADSAAATTDAGDGVAITRGNGVPNVNVNLGAERYNQVLEARLRDIMARNPDDPAGAILDEFLQRAPTAVFFLPPVYAFMLKLLYIRRRRLYAEHFVFALHFHSFAFLAMLAWFVPWDIMEPIALIAFIVYTYLAMRRYYRQGRLVTTGKAVALTISYFFVAILWMVAIFILAVFLA